MKLTRQLASEITRRGAEMHDALGEEQELRDARLRAINRNMDVQDIEQQVHEQIVAVREAWRTWRERWPISTRTRTASRKRSRNDAPSSSARRSACPRSSPSARRTWTSTNACRRACKISTSRTCRGIALAHLESELDAHRAEEDERSRERDAAMQKMQRRLREEELKVLRGEERVDEAEEFDEEEFDAKRGQGRARGRARRGPRASRGEAVRARGRRRGRCAKAGGGGGERRRGDEADDFSDGSSDDTSGTRTEGPPPTITTFDTGALARSARRFYTHDAWRVSRGTIRRGSLGDGVSPGRAGMGSEPPDARGAGDSSYPPRGYRSKACLGATFHSQFLNENGVPPVCVGGRVPENLRRAQDRAGGAARRVQVHVRGVRSARAERPRRGRRRRRAPSAAPPARASRSSSPTRTASTSTIPPRRLAFERDVLESVKRGRSREFAEQNPEVMAKLEEKIREKELEIRRVDARLAVETAERAEEAARIGRANAALRGARVPPRGPRDERPERPEPEFRTSRRGRRREVGLDPSKAWRGRR